MAQKKTDPMIEKVAREGLFGRSPDEMGRLKPAPDRNFHNGNGNGAGMSLEQKLFQKVSFGTLDELNVVLSQGPIVDTRDGQFNTPLIRASASGRDEMVSTLLAVNAGVNLQNNEGRTALMETVSKGYDHIASLLARAGADPNIKNNNGEDYYYVNHSWLNYSTLAFSISFSPRREVGGIKRSLRNL